MADYDYGAIVIGAGPGGYPCGIRLGQLGVKTLVIEKESWGGVCLNVGCIPSKALITAAKRFEEVQHAADMGVVVSGDVSVDMGKLQAWKQSIVSKLTGGVSTLLKANGVEQLVGTATITGPHSVSVATADGERTITAEHLVLATGSRPIEVPGFSFADGPVLDSTKALALDKVPGKLVVIGGGYIGLELGGMYAKIGTQVTVVEMMDSVLPGFDADAIKLIARKLKKAKVEVLTQTKALGWEKKGKGIVVTVQTPKGEQTLEADHVLVTVGRFPNTEGLGLEDVGVAKDGRFVKVDAQRRTSVPSIFAIGDVACQPMLAHKATYEGELVAEIIAGHKRVYDARTVPAVVFTDPEIATAGMSEKEAAARGEILVGKVPYAAVGRALTTGESDGFYKVIVDKQSHLILGVVICGSHASDLISEAGLAIEMHAEALDMGLTIHPHPTLGEGLMEAAKAALGEAIHIVNK
ncbi:MAG: dihydrolipoyl dehydrogenase [Alphaproteobacteria bacterium]|nr:dihydrolipoyl dehydrogenase [Alphaproteobacteria bacterium]